MKIIFAVRGNPRWFGRKNSHAHGLVETVIMTHFLWLIFIINENSLIALVCVLRMSHDNDLFSETDQSPIYVAPNVW